MIGFNRKPMLQSMCEDLVKLKQINFDNLDESAPKFKNRRKKMSPMQKLIVDQIEFYRGMLLICDGS